MKQILQIALGIVFGVVLLIILLPLLPIVRDLLLYTLFQLGSIFFG